MSNLGKENPELFMEMTVKALAKQLQKHMDRDLDTSKRIENAVLALQHGWSPDDHWEFNLRLYQALIKEAQETVGCTQELLRCERDYYADLMDGVDEERMRGVGDA